MKAHRTHLVRPLVFLALLVVATAAAAQDPSPIKRTEVHRDNVTAPGQEAVVMKVEVAGHALAPRHTHPGDEVSYVVAGEGDLMADGAPTRHLKPGEAYVIKAGVAHSFRNTGAAPVQLLNVYVVEKGKPIAVPAR